MGKCVFMHTHCIRSLQQALSIESHMLSLSPTSHRGVEEIQSWMTYDCVQGIRTLTGSEEAPSMICSVDTPENVSDATQTTISCLTDAKRVVLTDKLKGKAWTLSDLQVRGLHVYSAAELEKLRRHQLCALIGTVSRPAQKYA